LKSIKAVVGGEYLIAALSDTEKDVEFSAGAHPYWNSIRPPDDLYWSRVGGSRDATTTRTTTLDAVMSRLGLQGPMLLKLDVQGSEADILRGGATALKAVDVVIVESDIADFHDIHKVMTAADFSLYDVTNTNYGLNRTLGWFYPVYLTNRRPDLTPKEFWDKEHDAKVRDMQADRRRTILAELSKSLARLAARQKA
jgi:FkbM family methyltransferase